MSKPRRLFSQVFALFTGLLFVFALPVHAQTLPSPVIAVIDMNGVERQSEAWKSLRQQMEVLSGEHQAQLKVQQSELEEEQRQLMSQQNLLAADVFASRQQEFRNKLAELQKQARERKLGLERVYANARQQIRTALTEVSAEIARERGVNLMLNISRDDATISFVDKNMLVSEEALKRLNDRLSSVQVKVE